MPGKHATIWIKEENVALWESLENKSLFVGDSLGDDEDRLRALAALVIAEEKVLKKITQ